MAWCLVKTQGQLYLYLYTEIYDGVSKSFRTGRLERELQMVQLSATRCSCNSYFVSQPSEFYRHNTLRCFSTSVYCCLIRYRLIPETFGYTLVEYEVAQSIRVLFPEFILGRGRDFFFPLLCPVSCPMGTGDRAAAA